MIKNKPNWIQDRGVPLGTHKHTDYETEKDFEIVFPFY
jgi:hypothetical protein